MVCCGAQLAKDFRFYLAITEPAVGVRVRPAGSGVVRGGVMGTLITRASGFCSPWRATLLLETRGESPASPLEHCVTLVRKGGGDVWQGC